MQNGECGCGPERHTSRGKAQPKQAAISKLPRQAPLGSAHSLRTPCSDVRQQGVRRWRQGGPFAGKGLDEAEVIALHAVVLAVRCTNLQKTAPALPGLLEVK